MMKQNTKILSFRQYYLREAVLSIFSAALWLVLTVCDTRVLPDAEKPKANLLLWIAALVCCLPVGALRIKLSAEHDKMDELYRANLAKTNSVFVFVIMGLLPILAIPVFAVLRAKHIVLTFSPHMGWIFVTMFLLNALHSFIGMYVEGKDSSGEDD